MMRTRIFMTYLLVRLVVEPAGILFMKFNNNYSITKIPQTPILILKAPILELLPVLPGGPGKGSIEQTTCGDLRRAFQGLGSRTRTGARYDSEGLGSGGHCRVDVPFFFLSLSLALSLSLSLCLSQSPPLPWARRP